MTPAVGFFLGLLLLLLLVPLAWRYGSRRSSLPCPSWLGWLVELENPFAKSYNARSIIQRLELRPGMRVLDAGCGPGRVTIPLAQAVGAQGEVVAVDIQSSMLSRAQDKARTADITNIRFLEVGVGEGKLGSDEFDRALLVTVLGEIPDRRSALREIYRALKPGGMLSITEIIMDPHYQRRSTILQLASAVGFREKAFFWPSNCVHIEPGETWIKHRQEVRNQNN